MKAIVAETEMAHQGTSGGRMVSAGGLRLLQATRNEWLLVITTFAALLLLNVTVANRSIGLLLLGYLCVFSLRSPLSALLAISGSQIVADPVGAPFTLAQAMFLVLPFHFFSSPGGDYRPFRKLAVWTFPYILILKILNYVKWDAATFVDDFDLAILVGLMAAWYVGRLRGRFLLGLFAVALGAATSAITFWLGYVGIPTEGISFAKGADSLVGIGIGRGDGNFAGISISLAAILLLAFGYLSKTKLFSEDTLNKYLPYGCVLFFVSSVPPIFATMSRGGVITFFGGLSFVVLSILHVSNVAKGGMVLSLLLLLSTGFFFMGDDGALITKYAGSMMKYSESQIGASVMMSRTGTWEGALEEITNSPLIGTTPDTQVAVQGYGYEYNSHNVWLDVGRGAGIVGMCWFTAFFLYPVLRVFRYLPKAEALLYCSPMIVMFFVFMNLSLINYKIFYILWVLLVAASQQNSSQYRY